MTRADIRARRLHVVLATATLVGAAACSSTARPTQAHGSHPSARASTPATLANARPPRPAALQAVTLTAADVTQPAAQSPGPTEPAASSSTSAPSTTASPTAAAVPTPSHVSAAAVQPADDARVRTLLTWCTHTASTEDPAPTVYGPALTAQGPHGANTAYSYARALPAGTQTDSAAYAARLATCWQHVLMPVMAATLDPHIQHLTVSTSTVALPLAPVDYGSAQAVEGVIRWHPTPAQTETSVYDVAVVFGAHTMVTLLASGADGLMTGAAHLDADVTDIAKSIRMAEHPSRNHPPRPTHHR